MLICYSAFLCVSFQSTKVDPIKLGIPSYPDVVKHPMDLGTCGRKLDSNAEYRCASVGVVGVGANLLSISVEAKPLPTFLREEALLS